MSGSTRDSMSRRVAACDDSLWHALACHVIPWNGMAYRLPPPVHSSAREILVLVVLFAVDPQRRLFSCYFVFLSQGVAGYSNPCFSTIVVVSALSTLRPPR